MVTAFATSAADWLARRPELKSLRAAVCDFNGCLRGKRLPRDQAAKVLKDGVRMPLSLTAQDIWGRDIAANPMVEEGDGDALCLPTGRGPLAIDWLETPSAFLPLWFFTEDGAPAPTDPRQALARVVDRWAAKGLTPVVATELEFYLVNDSGRMPAAPASPVTGKPLHADGVLSMDDVDHFDGFLEDVITACLTCDIPVDTVTAEGGPGQFEINLRHVADPLRAADDALYFKRLVKGVARRHKLAATFMAKPFLDGSGNGFHVHFSVLDRDGRNIFDDGGPAGTEALRHAVAGLLTASEPMCLVFAPHLNSYRRIGAGIHAPNALTWAHENRFAAVRIPGGPSAARRIEHRIAGADANPYLVIATILGAALDGLEAGVEPPPPLDRMEDEPASLPVSWGRAIDIFRDSDIPGRILPPELCALYAACKQQEWETFGARMSEFEVTSYLDVV